MADKITIVLADDHPLFRQGLMHELQSEADFEIVAEANDGAQALELIRTLKPLVAILDVSMPRLDGFAAAQAMFDEKLPVSVIFLTMHHELKLFERALDLGVKGYVLKDSAAREIIRAVRAVADGQSFVSAELTSYLIEARKNSSKVSYSKHDSVKLSAAEQRVLSLIADGKTTSEIADELHISPRTVEGHRTHISQKLGLHGSHALLKYALQQKSASTLDSILKNT